MKVKDYVNSRINAWPSLYMMDNYEDSAFQVLHQAFITLGNGIEWANTGDPKTGGYLVDPIYEENPDGEWVRIKDKPYGEEKCELDPRVFNESLYYFYEIDIDASTKGFCVGKFGSDTVFESELKNLRKKYKVCDDKIDYVPGVHTHYYLPVPKLSSREDPYPNFSKRYSCFWEIDPELIKEDWRQAGIEHLKYWQGYFNDSERVKGYHYYKNPESLREWITKHYKENPEKHPDWIQAVRDGYEVQKFNGTNFEEMADIRWEKELKKTKDFLSETISRLEI